MTKNKKDKKDKLKAAVVGLGRIASLLEDDTLREKPCTHAGAISASADCVLVAGMDTNAERRRLFQERWQVNTYDDVALMLETERPAILHIATPPDSHARYCSLAAQKGVSVVVCEKPLAENVKEARKIAALHTRGKCRILTNHERRYSSDYIRAKEILASGLLGNVLGVRACLFFGRNRALDQVLWHDGTHLVDALMYLCGKRIRHRDVCGAKLSGKTGTAWLTGELRAPKNAAKAANADAFTDPLPFIIETGAGRDHLVFEIEFSCASGRLRIGNGIFEIWESRPSPYAEQFRSLQKTEEGFPGPTGYFANMIADAAACARDPSREPVSTAADGLAVVEYLNAVTGRGI